MSKGRLEKVRVELMGLVDGDEGEGGTLSPEAVLTFAKANPTSAVHGWLKKNHAFDPQKGLHAYALSLCGHLIRSVKVWLTAPDKKPVQVRAFLSQPSERGGDHGSYRVTARVLTDKERRNEMLQTALGEIEALARKYAALSELAAVWTAAWDVLAALRKQPPFAAAGD